MKTFLDIVAAWAALDLVLIGTWHLAHVRSRRFGAHVMATGSSQRFYTLAPEARRQETGPALVYAGRG